LTVHVIGNATADIAYRLDALPQPGETCLAGHKRADIGGKGLNQALAAARWGARVRLSIAIGDDEAGRSIERALAGETRLEVRPWRRSVATDESIIFVAKDGQNTIVSTCTCADSVSAGEVRAALRAAAPRDVLLVQGNLSTQATHAALSAARGKGITTIFNPAPIRHDVSALLPLADVLIANEVEAAATVCRKPLDAPGRLAAGAIAIITLGAAGSMTFGGGGTFAVPAARVRAVDTAGAGDAFVGTFAAAHAAGLGLREAVAAATAAAGHVVTMHGTFSAIASLPEGPQPAAHS